MPNPIKGMKIVTKIKLQFLGYLNIYSYFFIQTSLRFKVLYGRNVHKYYEIFRIKCFIFPYNMYFRDEKSLSFPLLNTKKIDVERPWGHCQSYYKNSHLSLVQKMSLITENCQIYSLDAFPRIRVKRKKYKN